MELRSGKKKIDPTLTKFEKALELHRGVRKTFKTRRIITQGIDDLWGADLLILNKCNKENKGFKYLLNVIDCFSKYSWSVALKTKKAYDVADAFEQILKNSSRTPRLLHVDRGKEFWNSIFKKLLKNYNIEMYHTYSEVKSSIVERFNRTLNEKMKIQFEINKNHKWLGILPEILSEYNDKNVHRTIGRPPSKVTKENEGEIFERMYPLKKFTLDTPTFKVGDRVRISRKKFMFSNKYL